MPRDFDPDKHCHDCGHRDKWKHNSYGGFDGYCKRCHRKNGYHVGVAIDIDTLEELVGPELTEKIKSAGHSSEVLS